MCVQSLETKEESEKKADVWNVFGSAAKNYSLIFSLAFFPISSKIKHAFKKLSLFLPLSLSSSLFLKSLSPLS